jgi:hypothetical protein
MKQFNIFSILVIIGLLILISAFIYDYINTENRPMGAVVLEHNVTADRYGNRTYTTIARTDDGIIIEKTGLNYYTIPTGSRVTIEVRRPKK